MLIHITDLSDFDSFLNIVNEISHCYQQNVLKVAVEVIRMFPVSVLLLDMMFMDSYITVALMCILHFTAVDVYG